MRNQNSIIESVFRDSSDSLRDALSPEEVLKPQSLPKILVVDDDPTFGKIMKRVAKQNEIQMTYCKSLDEFSSLESWDFDVAIIDYDLGGVTGFELTSYIESFTQQEMPVILVSQTQQKSSKNWPSTIREFIHKSLGPYAILDAAFEAHEIRRIHKEMSNKTVIH